jgi:hypothetical protein
MAEASNMYGKLGESIESNLLATASEARNFLQQVWFYVVGTRS